MGFSEKVKEEARRNQVSGASSVRNHLLKYIISFLKVKGEKIRLKMLHPFVPDATIYMETTLQKENRSVR